MSANCQWSTTASKSRNRPIALGRADWLCAGGVRAGQRAAAIMSLIGSAKVNGPDPCQLDGNARATAHSAGSPQ
jgi:hypothetical protein